MENSDRGVPITWSNVTAAVKLSKLQLRHVVKTGGYAPQDENANPEDSLIMRVILADMLENLAFLSPQERVLILDESTAAQEHVLFSRMGAVLLAFADGRYCTWTGLTGFLSLETGDTVQELPHPPLETISYNLTELFRRGINQITIQAERHARRQIDAKTVDESTNVREHSADGLS